MAGSEGGGPGLRDHEHADEAEERAGDTGAGHRLAEEEGREQRRPRSGW